MLERQNDTDMNKNKLLTSIAIGLIIALILLLFFPSLRLGNLFNTEQPLSVTSQAPMSYHQAVRKTAPAVVNIYNRSSNASLELGSGVIMNEMGYIITSYHVVENAESIIVALQDGRIFEGTIVGSDPLVDLSVLKIDGKTLPVIPINPEREPRIGDVVLAIGNPYNIGQTITQGIISATGRDGLSPYRRQNFIQTDASINSGNSGGALVNSLGELVGINTLSVEKRNSKEMPEGISFAIPTSLATKIMEKLIRDGRVIRGYIGIDGVELLPRNSAQDPHLAQGILVKNAEGPAKDAGIMPNDVIVSVDNIPVTSIITTMDQITEIPPQTEIPIEVIRDKERLTLHVTIGLHPN